MIAHATILIHVYIHALLWSNNGTANGNISDLTPCFVVTSRLLLSAVAYIFVPSFLDSPIRYPLSPLRAG